MRLLSPRAACRLHLPCRSFLTAGRQTSGHGPEPGPTRLRTALCDCLYHLHVLPCSSPSSSLLSHSACSSSSDCPPSGINFFYLQAERGPTSLLSSPLRLLPTVQQYKSPFSSIIRVAFRPPSPTPAMADRDTTTKEPQADGQDFQASLLVSESSTPSGQVVGEHCVTDRPTRASLSFSPAFRASASSRSRLRKLISI